MIRRGIVGCGGISWEHVRRLSLLNEGEARLVSLCDIDEKKAEALRRYANRFRNITPEPLDASSIFESYDKMLTEADLNAVIVCTPHSLHCQHAMKAIDKGLHVLVEKPMAVNVKEAEMMVEAASSRRQCLY